MTLSPRLPVIERVALTADAYLSVQALADYASLSPRTIRNLITDPVRPLPHFKIGSRVTVKKSDFDQWVSQHRRVGPDLEGQIERLQGKKRMRANRLGVV